jgi:hypothetical protein
MSLWSRIWSRPGTSAKVLIDPLSNVQKGTNYEKRTMVVLNKYLKMKLKLVGGKSDGGVDLIGTWKIPNTSSKALRSASGTTNFPERQLDVIVQCKAEKKAFGPNYVREMVLCTDTKRQWP